MAKVLVTGGAGYVGSHACKRLAQCGHVRIVFDNLFRGHAEFVKWGPLEEGDTLDKPRLLEVFKRHRRDAVMHFSALAYVGEFMENPGLYHRNYVVGSLSLLQAMLESGISLIVFWSTCAI